MPKITVWKKNSFDIFRFPIYEYIGLLDQSITSQNCIHLFTSFNFARFFQTHKLYNFIHRKSFYRFYSNVICRIKHGFRKYLGKYLISVRGLRLSSLIIVIIIFQRIFFFNSHLRNVPVIAGQIWPPYNRRCYCVRTMATKGEISGKCDRKFCVAFSPVKFSLLSDN